MSTVKPTDNPELVLRQNVARVAATPDGTALFQYLAEICGAHQRSVVASTSGEVNLHSTLYNEARRNVWLELQSLLPYESLPRILFPEPILLEEPQTEEPENERDGTELKPEPRDR